MAGNVRANAIAYDWLLQQAAYADDADTLEALNTLGRPPYSHREYRTLAELTVNYGGNYDMDMKDIIAIAILLPLSMPHGISTGWSGV